MTTRICFLVVMLTLPSGLEDVFAAPVLVSDGFDSYLVADNGIVSTAGTSATSGPVDTNTDHYLEIGEYSGQDLNVPDSWNGDRRWGNRGEQTMSVFTFTDLVDGEYSVYASWRDAPQSNVSLASYQVSDGGPTVDLDQRIGATAQSELTLNDGSNDIDFAFLATVNITDGDLSVVVADTATGPGDEPGGLDFIHTDAIAIGPIPEMVAADCDFNDDQNCDVIDIDALMNEVAAGTNLASFDLTADGLVNDMDRDAWLAEAGPLNGFSGPLLVGDANLDGGVDAQDLNALGVTWQTDNNNWTNGNFTGAGINAADLNALGRNWQASVAPAAALVPEPGTLALLFTLLLFVGRFLRI